MLPSFLLPFTLAADTPIISPPPSSMAFSFNTDYSPPPPSSDDISLFLRQLLHRSSSSTPSSSLQPPPLQNAGFSSSSAALDGYLRLPSQPAEAADHVSPSAGLSFWSEIPTGVCSNLTSSSTAPLESDSPTAGSGQLRCAENDVDDYDCESEEGPEDAQPKDNPQRNSSKRTRAAEVHNQSEKRRRSRINEKMKVLQNLIPNSNKTDKASMLDEAIEYLKQLQLQVQMLSMRNGLVLHPMCLPGFPGVLDPVQLCQLGLDFSNGDGSLETLPPAPSTRPPLDSLRGSIAAEAPFSLQSSTPNQLGSFHLLSSSENISRDSKSNALGGNGFNTESSSTRMPMPIAVGNLSSQTSYAEDGTQGVVQNSSTSHVQLISSNNLNGYRLQ